MMRRRTSFVIGLAAAGLVCMSLGLWIPAKAALAQVLISNAWERALDGKESPRPWPWADTWPVAKLAVPRIEKTVFVLANASGHALAFGPAHVAASAAPGQMDNVVFAGHRDTHFAFLRELEEGDEVTLETRAGLTRYRVNRTRVVHESQMEILDRSGRPELTLLTCFPFDSIVPGGPLRYVVHASMVTSIGALQMIARVTETSTD
jgi:sortase A